MSIRVMSWVWDNGPEDRAELLVLLALADFADDHGRCFPAVAAIARKTRMTERGVQKVVARLIETGRIHVKVNGGRGGANCYRVLMTVEANPEPETPNTVHPRTAGTPERGDRKPRTGVQKTPNGGSPEPSGTIKGTIPPLAPPTGGGRRRSKSEDEAGKAREALCEVMPPETVDEFMAHRRDKGARLTLLAARKIAKAMRDHPDPVAVVDHSIANGYTGLFPEKFTQPRASPQGAEKASLQAAMERAVAELKAEGLMQ